MHQLEILQNKAIRIITQSKYNDSASPLYKSLNIPKIQDIHHIQIIKFMYRIKNNTQPQALSNQFLPNTLVHTHQTRHRNDFHIHRPPTKQATRNLLHQAPIHWASLPQSLKTANTLKSLNYKLKKFYTSKY